MIYDEFEVLCYELLILLSSYWKTPFVAEAYGAGLPANPISRGRNTHIYRRYKYYLSATLFRRAVLTLWHAFLFLGLRFFPLFFFCLVASTDIYCKQLTLIFIGDIHMICTA
jgi:hypothetical protein